MAESEERGTVARVRGYANGGNDPLDQLLIDLRDLGWLTPSDALLLDAERGQLEAEVERLRERLDRLEWALLHPTTADAEALRAALSGRKEPGRGGV